MQPSLADSLGPIAFSDLRAHVARDAVIVVAQSLDLLEVAEAVARDDKARVGGWIASGKLGKPTLEALERWARASGDIGISVVVQPFVLVKERLD